MAKEPVMPSLLQVLILAINSAKQAIWTLYWIGVTSDSRLQRGAQLSAATSAACSDKCCRLLLPATEGPEERLTLYPVPCVQAPKRSTVNQRLGERLEISCCFFSLPNAIAK
jgi:hypothetical protein